MEGVGWDEEEREGGDCEVKQAAGSPLPLPDHRLLHACDPREMEPRNRGEGGGGRCPIPQASSTRLCRTYLHRDEGRRVPHLPPVPPFISSPSSTWWCSRCWGPGVYRRRGDT